jgi:hypothetical protein
MSMNEPATSGWLLRTGGCVTAIVLLLYFVGLWFGRALGPIKTAGRSVQCQGNVRQLVRAEQMYAMDYDDHFSPAKEWMDRIDFFVDARPSDPRHCPEATRKDAQAYGYALNAYLGGLARSKIDQIDRVPLLFDSPDLGRSAVSKGVKLPAPGRHIGHEKKGERMSKGNYVGLAGGGVKFRADK